MSHQDGPWMPAAHLRQLDMLAEHYWWHVHRIRTVVQLARRFARGRTLEGGYLDVGCGPGSTTRLIADGLARTAVLRHDAEVVGIDHDARLEAPCREHRVRLIAIDLETDGSGLADGKYGFFTALDVLEHLARPGHILRDVRAKLAPGGLGVITVPAFPLLTSSWDVAAGHHRRYRREALHALLTDSGFRVLWGSYLFSFAFLPALILRRRAPQDSTLEFPAVTTAVNKCLLAAGALERVFLRGAALPVGTSAVAVVER